MGPLGDMAFPSPRPGLVCSLHPSHQLATPFQLCVLPRKSSNPCFHPSLLLSFQIHGGP